ncbi:RloA protein, partial [mine drainage metagenome]
MYEFTVENFRSFGSAQTLSLMKGKEQKKPENLTAGPSGFPKAVRVAAIFGHNASGKSNLFLAAQTVWQTIMFSATGLNSGNLIPGIIPHRLDPSWDDKPTRFEIVFPVRDRVFRYGFSALPKMITAETLVEELSSGKQRTLFDRKIRTTGDASQVEFSEEFDRAAKDNVPKLTRDNALILSSGANLNVPLLRDIHARIGTGAVPVSFSPIGPTPGLLAKNIQEDTSFRSQLMAALRDADIGIT